MQQRITRVLIIALLFVYAGSYGQAANERLIMRIKQFHQLMVNDQNRSICQYLDDSLSYGHSNGWVENRNEFYHNLGNRLIYHSYKEDSVMVSVNKRIANIRCIADIDVTLDGKRNLYHLKVLEVWVKRGKNWKIFARQATK